MTGMASDVRIGILGPLEVRVGFGEPVEVVGPRLRTLVVRLALDPDPGAAVQPADRRGLGFGTAGPRPPTPCSRWCRGCAG
jgi:hypothetical protein